MTDDRFEIPVLDQLKFRDQLCSGMTLETQSNADVDKAYEYISELEAELERLRQVIRVAGIDG